ncbi:MAG: DUF3149 domain-containing protein [Betaproteobacteria bacterium]|nr:DUF3149 domain-containing protein [Betaproteobacteria bacterium]
MVMLQNLLSTDYGLMSLVVIVGVLVMGGWFAVWFNKKMSGGANDA